MTDKIPEFLPALGRLLAFASRGVSALCEKELAPHGLTLTHWVILTALWRNDGMTIGELAHYYHANDAVLTRTLDRMADRDLLKREADPKDRRVVRIRLTKKAKGLSHLIDFYQDINKVLLKGFTTQESHALFELLERVNANSEEAQRAKSE